MPAIAREFHPAADWAITQSFTPTEVDCTTTVVLKILDGKCKMLPGEKKAVMAIYKVVRKQPGQLFDAATHRLIEQCWHQDKHNLSDRIHDMRLYAEQNIAKPVMKKYKARLRDALFG